MDKCLLCLGMGFFLTFLFFIFFKISGQPLKFPLQLTSQDKGAVDRTSSRAKIRGQGNMLHGISAHYGQISLFISPHKAAFAVDQSQSGLFMYNARAGDLLGEILDSVLVKFK